MQPSRIGEVVDQRVERPSIGHKEAAERECDPDVQFNWYAQEARAALILANGQHSTAEGGAQDKRHRRHGECEAEQDEIVERSRVVEDIQGGDAQMQWLAVEWTQAIIASGDRRPLEGDVIKYLAEGDSNHGKINTAPTHDQGAQHRASEPARQRSSKDSERC